MSTLITTSWLHFLVSIDGSLPRNLQYVAVPLINNAQCAKSEFPDPGFPNLINSNMLCSGNTGNGKGPCTKDSGKTHKVYFYKNQ